MGRNFAFWLLLAVAGGMQVHAAVATDTPADGPQSRQVNGIQYISGGIGSDEAALMRRLARQYTVRLHFVDAADGSALSDVSVTLFDGTRLDVFHVLSEGPYLYLNPPAGEYHVVVRYGAAIACRHFKVSAGGHATEVLVRFPSTGAVIAQPLASRAGINQKSSVVGPCRAAGYGTCRCAGPDVREGSD